MSKHCATSNSTTVVPFGPSAERNQQNALRIISDSILFDQLMETLKKSASISGNQFNYENEYLYHGYTNAYEVLGLPEDEGIHKVLGDIYDQAMSSSYMPDIAAKTVLAGWFQALVSFVPKES